MRLPPAIGCCHPLTEEATTEDFLVVRQEGQRPVRRCIKNYHLDAITSLGCRVSFRRTTNLRCNVSQSHSAGDSYGNHHGACACRRKDQSTGHENAGFNGLDRV
ncbi:virulence RhuM family protein [Pusillimonas sp. 7-48]|uniref:Virulence RhuM family protein n=1 Tax=Pusillimonas minor TaxID=2697024 RepID=A0A842HQR7_9BURK|nr:virulence RhuM family protein [Pusillimonas minor]